MPVHSLDEAVKTFSEESLKETGNQFVEGIMFNLKQGVIMTGNMVDSLQTNDKVSFLFLF
jgi:hypothetical protein